MADAAIAEVFEQGVDPKNIEATKTVHIRPADAQRRLEVPFGRPASMQSAFLEAHKQRYGY